MGFVTFSSLYSFKGAYASRFSIPNADKLVHITFYLVACILGIYFLRERTKGNMPLKRAMLSMLVFMICFGAIIEVVQDAVTLNRTGDVLDALANTLGAFCGAVFCTFPFTGKRSLQWKV